VREILDRAGIDRRNRGAKGDALGGERQSRALRHVAESARHVNAGKAAPLDFAREVECLTPPPWHGNEADGG